jgi:hypothetical protein
MKIAPTHPAIAQGVTVYRKSLRDIADYEYRPLKAASGNSKMGNGSNIIIKSKWRGMPMYTLTLEERSTCPPTCQQYITCYGNNMPFAHRLTGDTGLLMLRLSENLELLQNAHPDGFVVRLHVLGDFFSLDYVKFWIDALAFYPALRIFGYTHRLGSIQDLIRSGLQNDRAVVRTSDTGGRLSANVMGEGITCPQEVQRTESCLTCGLCWQTERPIRFLTH